MNPYFSFYLNFCNKRKVYKSPFVTFYNGGVTKDGNKRCRDSLF